MTSGAQALKSYGNVVRHAPRKGAPGDPAISEVANGEQFVEQLPKAQEYLVSATGCVRFFSQTALSEATSNSLSAQLGPASRATASQCAGGANGLKLV